MKDVLPRLFKSKLLRFPVVGLGSSAIYALATWFYISQLGLSSKPATFAGYATAIPFAFFAHRNFTFGSKGPIQTELLRFAIVHAVGLTVSWLAMGLAVDRLHLHYAVGIGGAVVLVPIVSFFLFDRWVFKPRVALAEK